ncbi:lipoate--protein ligase family protein [soil metagenome]
MKKMGGDYSGEETGGGERETWPLEKLEVWEDGERGSGAWNMAMDEALLRSAQIPILRCYRWGRPTLSIGYFTAIAEVRAHGSAGGGAGDEADGAPDIVRRLTGGGVVDHAADFAFSLVVPRMWWRGWERNPGASYARIHEALAGALHAEGIAARLAGGGGGGAAALGSAVAAGRCFDAPVASDVLIGDLKIAGGAQKRTRHGLLHQGSIQLPGGRRPGAGFASALGSRLAAADVDLLAAPPPPQASALATDLVATRYGTRAWTERC